MADVTQVLSEIEQGDPSAAEQLLPLVCDELRRLAAARLRNEKRGQTLQATALVHEAYVRLVNVPEVGGELEQPGTFLWCRGRGDAADIGGTGSAKEELTGGCRLNRFELSDADLADGDGGFDVIVLDDAIARLECHDPRGEHVRQAAVFWRSDNRSGCRGDWNQPRNC